MWDAKLKKNFFLPKKKKEKDRKTAIITATEKS
jgi:hypothetical protein